MLVRRGRRSGSSIGRRVDTSYKLPSERRIAQMTSQRVLIIGLDPDKLDMTAAMPSAGRLPRRVSAIHRQYSSVDEGGFL